MFGGGPWRGRVLLVGLLLVLYLAAAVFISGLHDVHPGFANRVLRSGNGFMVAETASGSGQRFYHLGGLPNTYRILPGRRLRLQWCSHLNFQRPPGPAVALVSFPGSGNTWLRYLIQQATGIYTGSIYKDYGLLKNGFPAESVVNGSVVVVKTHEWGVRARAPFVRAVLLVRTPSAAIQAEFNRQSGGHIGFASPERYKRMKGQYWQQFVTNNLASWRDTYLDWLYNFTGPTHVIFYDRLVQDVAGTLKGLMHFLNITHERTHMACALDRREGIYRRRKRILNFDPYTADMKIALKKQQSIVYQAIYSSVSVSTNDNLH